MCSVSYGDIRSVEPKDCPIPNLIYVKEVKYVAPRMVARLENIFPQVVTQFIFFF